MSSRARRRHRRTGRKRNPFLLAVTVLGSIVAMVVLSIGVWALAIAAETPPIDEMQPIDEGANSVIYAADGSRLGFIQSDVSRTPVELDAIPEDLQNATVAIEDARFYDHSGIDLEGVARAAYNNFSAGETKEGGSTITQQLARNLYIADPKRDIERKIREMTIAQDLEDEYSKQEILNQYLNTASYGTVQGRTAIGVEAAAQVYFSKPARNLNLAESALLAGLPQSPSRYNPLLDPADALERRNEVLDAMAENDYITDEEAEETSNEEIKLTPGTKYTDIREPYIFEYVEQQLIEEYGVNTVRNGGLKVYTSIDPRLQAEAQQAVDSCSVCSEGGPASALASVNPDDGEIVALASSQRYSSDSQFNFAANAERQPGSSFKVYVLAAAIKQGIDPDETFYDGTSPAMLDPGDGTTWEVNNAEAGGGVEPLTAATWHSVNVVFAKLALDVGLGNVADTAYDMGVTTPLGITDKGEPCERESPTCFIPPADALGGLSTGLTPLEQASAYATLANGGVHHEPTAVRKVVFSDGATEEASEDEGNRVMTAGEAYTVTKVLEGVITSGTGAGYTSLSCSAAAGKTGTSEDLSDAWFVGYTPDYSTAVWTGHPLSRASTGFGGPTSGPVWRSFMEAAQGGECPEFDVPETLPTLTAFNGSHTSSSSSSRCTTDAIGGSSSTSCTAPEPVTEEDPTKDESKDDGGGGDNGSYAPGKGQKPAPNPSPTPAPAPTPTPEPTPPAGPGGGITP